MAPKAANYVEKIPKQRGRCTSCICMSWKVFTCIVSHVMLISLVVGYCLLGSIAFEYLEAEHERNVKSGIKYIRGNLSHDLWIYTHEKIDYLREDEWTNNATKKLIDFENEILKTMKTDGWDGIEDPKRQQWTQMGALFYSIIVITTIGYGHIAPKTDAGKISTIFYAIVGIPLMLLCLSNIGDIMASSFRFIYWRIFCFVCEREPKRRPRTEFQRSISQPQPRAISQPRYSNRASIRRSVRISQRTADSGIDSFRDPKLLHAYSDTDLRYGGDDAISKRNSNRSQRFSRYRNRDRFRQDRHTLERERVVERYPKRQNNSVTLDRRSRPRSYNNQRSLRAHSMARGEDQSHSRHMANEIVHNYTMTLPASHGRHRSRRNELRAQSVDPRCLNSKNDAPVLCNKYAIDALLHRESLNNERQKRSKSMPRPQHHTKSLYSPSPERETKAIVASERQSLETIPKRLTATERSRFLAPPIAPDQCHDEEEEFIELESPVRRIKRKEKSQLPPSPRIMSPMGFAIHRQARLQQFDEEAMFDDEWIDYTSEMPIVRPVPIWLCVFLVIGYIIGGAFYFNHSEPWSFLDSAYFCFITLTTIGFGDFVPAQGLNASALREPTTWSMANISSTFHVTDQEIKIAGCSVYLLFGISLLAMSFNLVQEEVIANVKNVARQLGILKEEDSDYY